MTVWEETRTERRERSVAATGSNRDEPGIAGGDGGGRRVRSLPLVVESTAWLNSVFE